MLFYAGDAWDLLMLFYAGDIAIFSLEEARRNPTIWHNPTRSNARHNPTKSNLTIGTRIEYPQTFIALPVHDIKPCPRISLGEAGTQPRGSMSVWRSLVASHHLGPLKNSTPASS